MVRFRPIRVSRSCCPCNFRLGSPFVLSLSYSGNPDVVAILSLGRGAGGFWQKGLRHLSLTPCSRLHAISERLLREAG